MSTEYQTEDELMEICMRLAKVINPEGYRVSMGIPDSPGASREPEPDVEPYLCGGQVDLYSARRHRNTATSHVYVLPAELLTSIFLIVLEDSDSQFINHHLCAIRSGHKRVPEKSPYLVILAMAHVCHHWYEAIANCPSMWTIIDANTNPLLVDLALERSKDAPLDVRMGYKGFMTKERWKEGLRNAIAQSGRWTKAHFLCYISELELFRRPIQDVPNLEELYIVPVSTSENPGDRPTDVFMFLPSLKRLHIGWWPGWEDKYMPNLRVLAICEAGPPRATLSQIFQMLEKLPLLEYLEISAEVEIGPELTGPLPRLPSIELANLTYLELAGWTLIETELFLRAVSFPSCQIINLCGGPNPPGDDLARLRRSIITRITPYIRPIMAQTTSIEVVLCEESIKLKFSASMKSPPGLLDLGQFPWTEVIDWASTEFPAFNESCIAVSWDVNNPRYHLPELQSIFPWILKLNKLAVVQFYPNSVVMDRVLTFLFGVGYPEYGKRGFNPWPNLERLLLLFCQCQQAKAFAQTMKAVAEAKSRGADAEKYMIKPICIMVNVGADCKTCRSARVEVYQAGKQADLPVHIAVNKSWLN